MPVDSNAWDALAGMATLKDQIERRLLLPMRERARASRHGITPPGAVLLFGPPGTGKTALARAIAGRLGWAFVDVDLSTVALDAARLRRLFDHLFQLEEVVIFFDEFEHLGLNRESQTTPVEPLTAELLRGLPALRASGKLLAVCATNYVRLLDPALLRPGRFDLVLPIGLPDAGDRAALLRALLARRPCGEIDVAAVVARADGLTPADLGAVCQQAAQAAFEREVATGRESRVETADLILALNRYRPTVSPEDIVAFREDVERYARA
ncbi:MAG TPA: ATP-binding protein [Chloroflexota bacterium]|nr:ATP-binding protein [Chloroflexota bacterium]